ncbi:MAG: alpha/beta fold hydrolase [Gemmatimonadales bacterium]
MIADTFRPLLREPSLAGRYRLILYHRRGYAGSSRASGPVSVARQAADCRALLRHLSVERAHVVGHSYGGAVALQLALDAPGVACSLALLEPALMVGVSAQGYRESLARAVERYREAGAAVVDEFLQARWPGYRVRCRGPSLGRWPTREPRSSASCPGYWTGASARWKRGASVSRPCACSAARAPLSRPASARRTGCCWIGCRTPKGSFCPARRTSRSSRTRAAWPRCSRPSGHATGSPPGLPSPIPGPFRR